MTTGHVWTASMMATFRALHRNGTGSFGDMAKQMSETFGIEITRNALIGKARRMELPMRKSDRPRKSGPVSIQKRVIRPGRIRKAPPLAPIDTLPGLTIYQLTSTTCRWPLGEVQDQPPYRFCGCMAQFEQPYCGKHRRMGSIRPRVEWS
jgi:hypothetical protein